MSDNVIMLIILGVFALIGVGFLFYAFIKFKEANIIYPKYKNEGIKLDVVVESCTLVGYDTNSRTNRSERRYHTVYSYIDQNDNKKYIDSNVSTNRRKKVGSVSQMYFHPEFEGKGYKRLSDIYKLAIIPTIMGFAFILPICVLICQMITGVV